VHSLCYWAGLRHGVIAVIIQLLQGKFSHFVSSKSLTGVFFVSSFCTLGNTLRNVLTGLNISSGCCIEIFAIC